MTVIRTPFLTSQQITQTLDEMLFANLDVTTHVLTWIITLLADYPAVQSKLRDEIRANLASIDEYINKKDSYLHNCFFESLRVRPVSGMLPLQKCTHLTESEPTNTHQAFSIPESSPSPKRFKGYIIPKNVGIVSCLFYLIIANQIRCRLMSLLIHSLSICGIHFGVKTAQLSAPSALRP